MFHATRTVLCGLAVLLLTGSSGCWRSQVEPTSAVVEDPALDRPAPTPVVDRPGVEDVSKGDLVLLANAADRYCQALAQLGCRVSVTVNLSYADVTDADVFLLAFPAATKSINFSNTPIGDDSVAALANLAGLQSLMLGSTKVTDRSLSYLQQLPKLSALDLMNTNMSPEAQATLMAVVEARAAQEAPAPMADSPGWVFNTAALETANAAVADIDRYADAIAKFGGTVDVQLDFANLPLTDADLEKLPLAACVRGLDLASTQVTDQTPKNLRKHVSLERISLVKTTVGEAGVKELMEMPNLCEANLEGVNISFATRMALVRALAPHLSAKAKSRGR